mgnify:CR=1 FL=1
MLRGMSFALIHELPNAMRPREKLLSLGPAALSNAELLAIVLRTGFRGCGVLQMADDKGLDDKIIAVHADDPAYRHYKHIDELPPHTLLELKRFFEDYKILENKQVKVQDFQGPEQAQKVIRDGLEGYRQLRARKG